MAKDSNSMNAPVRVFQVTTGDVSSEMIKRIATHPDLELVGLLC
jgi:4-hydroxy-tetrahydrodipicolinate reductase